MAVSQDIDVKILPACPESTAEISITQQPISVSVGGKTLKIYSQQTEPATSPRLTVLLLHGQAFTSQNWVEINTLPLLASWGYRAVAIDLPGYGQSKDVSLDGVSQEDFMAALVGTLGSLPVIVSPSMSGAFSLPYLFSDPSGSTQRATAYIPVAPVMTDQYTANYPESQLPTLIVYGENDEQLGSRSHDDLKVLPASKVAALPEAGHACYMNQPAMFHNVVYQFLSSVEGQED
ncbi:putative protein-lysine deacylase ABHD14B [Littorina saxatilis]|uniref:AB hydrolase-1 domain-containing protein n=1 Tax=Littorina saxatilis TaxID=31220 RepID=A0AAN9G4H6_9CAEN